MQTIPQIELFDEPVVRLSKKQKRLLRRQQPSIQQSLKIRHIEPLTKNQNRMFEAYYSPKNLLMTGCPGTGKTFLSLYLALDEILSEESSFKKIIIFRSAVEGRRIGFLPGKPKDKLAVYEAPYHGICADLFGKSDAYDTLKNRGLIQFESTSFLRGITINDSIIIVDEAQNLNMQELHTIMTRFGKGSKILFAGDVRQVDLEKRKETSGLYDFMKILNAMSSFVTIDFSVEDIVRDPLVKEYIIAKMKLENEGHIEIV
jgi:phosphate starvation-inducible protein PhoH